MSFVNIPDVPRTFGALLVGALFASFLSGGVTVQTLVYYKLYPGDDSNIKSLVFVIWLLDSCHTGLIWGSQWEYFIGLYGQETKIDYIPSTLALSIVFTGVLTFLVHSFFAQRIFRLSKRNWILVVPVVGIAALRLISATATSGTMLHYRSFTQFRDHVRWLFTLGLALSSVVDVMITLSLFVLLKRSKTEVGSLDGVIDSLILYTFETGSVTCAATIISMILWIAVPTQLFFMALHFIIGKFYATSFLVTLNSRRGLRQVRNSQRGSSSGGGRGRPAYVLDNRRPEFRASKNGGYDVAKSTVTELQINVQRSVEYTSDSFADINNGYGPRSSL
ncbi:hypothetical protein GYMLUDRAFT_42220 [Collybiopsis luxurians FD-317 M1]|uniref:DUF6534 domain-containing protein n=1 Tax=Collybiopsis luxurians FD-317 M1 TaxID=944289 RepID=A0A0D0C2D4_9AGAR|nr:hypothetical protein GYMLUDRAFT_42220 [Collybiopsis luxurians FD-317 M1]